MNLFDLNNMVKDFGKTAQMPVLFIGHGSPMNAILDNAFTRSLGKLGNSFSEKPNAILVVSAHWLTRGTRVTVTDKPKVIYDFGGFPEALYHVEYPAPGAPAYAKQTKEMVKSAPVLEDEQWGLDHGAWTVLKHMFPKADIPVFQLSIDATKPAEYHYNLANELKLLRKKGVLILASGNIVHNLYQIDYDIDAKPYNWAVEFDEIVKSKLLKREFNDLVNYQSLGSAAQQSIPTNDHYLPMLYALGLAEDKDELKFTFEGIQNASISMRGFQLG